jgi:hypothetical protein
MTPVIRTTPALLIAALLGACADDGKDQPDAGPDAGDDYHLDWQALDPVGPQREERHGYIVVWLTGTPTEMGQQHGDLLRNELQDGIENSSYVQQILDMMPLARMLGFDDMALEQSYPSVVEECEGMVDSAGDVGWTMELCLIVNFGDVMLENMPASSGMTAPGCSQLIAAGAATADGRLYHGRLLDWGVVDFLLDYPVIFVRQPAGEIPHVYIGFPGNLSPYSGINAEGISMGSNEADPGGDDQSDDAGRSHVQMLGRLLAEQTDLQGALAAIEGADHMSVEAFGVADGAGRFGAAVEMTATTVGVRQMQDETVYLTNHFVAPETEELDLFPSSQSSLLRYDRLTQLVPPDGEDTRYGEIDAPVLVEILRDRVNPYTHEEAPVGTFDNNGSLATNGALYAIAFDPGRYRFWVAAGQTPVPEQPFVGFSLAELLGAPDAPPLEPEIID